MKDGMVNGSMSHIDCFNLFVANIEEVVSGDRKFRSLKNVDLVFFPVIQGSHFYLICFDMKIGRVILLDNMIYTIPFEGRYGEFPNKLKSIFVEYLKSIGNVKANDIEEADFEAPELKWGTRKNVVDCGIFVMRHMETFAGGHLSRWDCDICEENRAQKFILTKLRKKYVTKLLLSNENKQKTKVLLDARSYANSLKALGRGY
ncbi:uncharacterized protein [Rutidosis leptorrhynchoides]|uniref:uncharacterized protein n=1 Tax=Rutidosis leptorrhynchoides TaxID=125765 RepID=UPI003A9A04A1